MKRWLLLCALLLGVAGWWATPAAVETPYFSVPSLVTASTDETVGVAISPDQMARCRETAVYVDWTTGTLSGGVVVETAMTQGYTGRWAPLATVTFSGTAPLQDVVQITGAHQWLRTRVDTAVGSGTVNTYILCN
jgi:hypothetical protein